MKSFLIKKQGQTQIDIYQQWGILAKHVSPKPFPNKKPVAVRTWPDEQGDDEYEPDTDVYDSEEIAITFAYEGAVGSVAEKVIGFLEYLQGGELSFKDEYTGRKGLMRYVGYNDDSYWSRNRDILEFTVKFKINNPTLAGEIA